MDGLKRIGNKLKVILTQIIAFILSFFKTEKKDTTIVKEDTKKVSEKKEVKVEITTHDSGSLPDEDASKDDDQLHYKQSIAVIDSDDKDKLLAKTDKKEIYFSEATIINTILDVVEEKNDFKFVDLSQSKKDEIQKEVEELNERLSPPIKEEMLDNKISTKEELKDNIAKRIDAIYEEYNPIVGILQKEDKVVEIKQEEKEVKVEQEEKEVKVEQESPIEKEAKRDSPKSKIIKIEKKKKKEERFYFIADLLPVKDNKINVRTTSKIDTDKDFLLDAKKETAQAMKIRSSKLPFLMVPTSKYDKRLAKEKIKNAPVEAILLTSSVGTACKTEEKEKEEKVEVVTGAPKEVEEKKEIEVTITKPKEPELTEEEMRIADIAVDREILEEIRANIQKQKEEMAPYLKEEIIRKEAEVQEEKIEAKEEVQEEKKEDKEEVHEIVKEQEIIPEPVIEQEITIHKEVGIEEEPNVEIEISTTPVDEEQEEETVMEERHEEEITEEDLPKIVDEEKNEDKDRNNGKKKIKDIGTIKQENNVEEKEILNLEHQTNRIIEKTTIEINKDELEDKDYDKVEKKIDDLLYDCEMLQIKNEDTLSKDNISRLEKIKERLREVKDSLSNQRDKDIEKEKQALERELEDTEIALIQEEIKKMHLEHQEEVNEVLLRELKRLETKSDAKIEEIEQKLIKKKLKRALRVAELPSILALPFIRNSYFLFFTIGLFVNNHFNFLMDYLREKQ